MPRKKSANSTAAGPGHNSVDRDRLRSLVDRIENLEVEISERRADIKDVYAEAKSAGFDVAAIRQVIKLRKQDAAERAAHQSVVDEYLAALGDFASTELGQSAISRASAGLAPPV